ncbi:HAD family hydrolase [Paenibacillus antarcticus]|uniref:Haloacid dehalogenase n=1 Tax=Paenibacillus antarcticus TaxID=253703 RepID=A0A168JKM2_9BACL|nr:HAD family hydrolase [Paenibacillus antarcticus]OAB40756.1 haloacid dehalogenase [Paenibacillus antarcticus]
MATLQAGQYNVPCEAILFDKDGTLFQFMMLWGKWAESVLTGMEKRLMLLGKDFTGSIAQVLGTQHDPQGQVCGYDLQGPLAMATIEETHGILAWQLYAAGIPWNEALAQAIEICKDAMLDIRQKKPIVLMNGLLHFLQECKGASIRLGVVTSDETSSTVEQLNWAGISQYFEVIIGRDQVSLGKPHPEMVERASLALGIESQNIVVIGDTNADMQMAKRAGVKLVIGITSLSESTACLLDADVMITDYRDLKVKE